MQGCSLLKSGKTTILLADNHAIVRRGIKALLEYEPDFLVVAEASDGAAALGLIESHQPHILVTDLCMPNMSGIELLKIIKEKKLSIRSVVLSMCGDAPYVTGALDAGAYGFVLKEAGVEHLVTAIREAYAGQQGPLVEDFCLNNDHGEAILSVGDLYLSADLPRQSALWLYRTV